MKKFKSLLAVMLSLTVVLCTVMGSKVQVEAKETVDKAPYEAFIRDLWTNTIGTSFMGYKMQDWDGEKALNFMQSVIPGSLPESGQYKTEGYNYDEDGYYEASVDKNGTNEYNYDTMVDVRSNQWLLHVGQGGIYSYLGPGVMKCTQLLSLFGHSLPIRYKNLSEMSTINGMNAKEAIFGPQPGNDVEKSIYFDDGSMLYFHNATFFEVTYYPSHENRTPHISMTVGDDLVTEVAYRTYHEFVFPDEMESSREMYRLYNPNSSEHFYTESTKERDYLVTVGWQYEGVAWTAPLYSNTPVWRVYNPNSGEHHYTTSHTELCTLVDSMGWNYEGVGWYSDDYKANTVYRLYNPNAKGAAEAGAHHYTRDANERDYLSSIGWNDEGIGWFGL